MEQSVFSVVDTTEVEDFGALELSVDGSLASISISCCCCSNAN